MLAPAVAATGAFIAYLFSSERPGTDAGNEELSARVRFLESLVASIGEIAAARAPEQVLEQTRRQAERLFGARASLGAADGPAAGADDPRQLVVPLRVGQERTVPLRLERERPFDPEEASRAAFLADFASRANENARLLADAQVRQAERARLSEQLITAEQEERRRLALFIHDGPVQSMSGIALMLDAAVASLERGQADDAREVLNGALVRQRDAIRNLRDLSFALEPVVLRDQGFGPAVRALAERLALSNDIRIELDIDAGDLLAERAQVGLYQLVQEALNQALQRRPTRVAIRVERTGDGIEATIVDDGGRERRRGNFEAIAERARTLDGRLTVDQQAGGTTVRVLLPYLGGHG